MASKSHTAPSFPVPLTFSERLQRFESNAEPDWLVHGLIMRNETMLLGAPEKGFKTHLTTDIGMSVAAGVPVFGKFPVTEAVPVLAYVLEDTNEKRFTQDMLLVANERRIDPRKTPYHTIHDFDLRYVAQQIIHTGAKLLTLDCQSKAFDIDQTDQNDYYRKVGPLVSICEKHECQLLLVHHTMDSKPEGHRAFRGAGASSFARQWLTIKPGKFNNGNITLSICRSGSGWSLPSFQARISQCPDEVGRPTQWSIDVLGANESPQHETDTREPKQKSPCSAKQKEKIDKWLRGNPGFHGVNEIARGASVRKDSVSKLVKSGCYEQMGERYSLGNHLDTEPVPGTTLVSGTTSGTTSINKTHSVSASLHGSGNHPLCI